MWVRLVDVAQILHKDMIIAKATNARECDWDVEIVGMRNNVYCVASSEPGFQWGQVNKAPELVVDTTPNPGTRPQSACHDQAVRKMSSGLRRQEGR